MVKRVLMIAYHFPPLRGSSGIQRTLKFAQYLPRHGWEPLVLTTRPCAYPERSDDQLGDIGAGVHVHRSFALDTARHLALGGRYPGLLAQPDRWISWWLSAVPAGLALIRRHRPQLIWSSYPIATAHLIALSLHRLSGIAWVADQRDPMLDGDYPPDPRRRRLHRWIENKVMRHSAAVVHTTPGAVQACRQRHPQHAAAQLRLIENGYDEDSFSGAGTPRRDGGGQSAPFRLLHSGLIYPSERDPRPLLAALERLRQHGDVNPGSFRLVLRASGHDPYLAPLIRQAGLSEMVELAPALPYRAALAEMLAADGLLLLQAANCNGQIPAKLYEYLRARRPLLALTDPAGDTAAALRLAGIDTMADLADSAAISRALLRFLHLCRTAQAPLARAACVEQHSRAARTAELAALFDQLIKESP